MQTSKVGLAVLITAGLVSYCIKIAAYDNFVIHPSLTEAAISVYSRDGQKSLSADEKKWLREGSIAEDADPRYLNHYYDPSTGQGLNDEGHTGLPAKTWAQVQNNWTAFTGDYSQSMIMENYRTGDYHRAWRGVGQILHLVQDMSVPAHTRNDAHAEGDSYEKWAEKYGRINISTSNKVSISNLDNAFDELATFSHTNFYSKDSVIGLNIPTEKIVKQKNNGIEDGYVVRNISGKETKMCVIDRYSIITKCIIQDDTFSVHLDYWTHLHPKAIGYSAGVLEYFVKEFEKIDAERSAPGLLGRVGNYLSDFGSKAVYLSGDAFFYARNETSEAFWARVDLIGTIGKYIGVIDKDTDHREPVNDAINETIGQVSGAVETAGNIKDQAGEAAIKAADATAQAAADVKRQTEIAAKKAADEAKKKADEAKKLADLAKQKAEDLAKKAADEARKKAESAAKLGKDALDLGIKEAKAAKDGALEYIKDLAKEDEKTNSSGSKTEVFKILNPGQENNGTQTGFLSSNYFPIAQSFRPVIIPSAEPIEYSADLDTIIAEAPPELSSSSFAHFRLESIPAGKEFECLYLHEDIDSGWIPCEPEFNRHSEDGYSVIYVRAYDNGAVDPTPAGYGWMTDTIPPGISTLGAPALYDNSGSYHFNFNNEEDDSVIYQYSLDSGDTMYCGASTTFHSLPDGWHDLAVLATDAAGNTSSTSISWLQDTVAPECAFELIESLPSAGDTIRWACSDPGDANSSRLTSYDIEYRIDDGEWQIWTNALSGENQASGSPESVYEKYFSAPEITGASSVTFRIRGADRAGNEGDWSESARVDIVISGTDHVVISRLYTGNQFNPKNEWVELYNPTDNPINLDTYKLKRKTENSAEYYNLVADFPNIDIAPHGYILVAHPTEYDINIKPDVLYTGATFGLADNNTVILFDGADIIDKVGYGSASDCETAPFPENHGPSAALARKAGKNSNSETMQKGRFELDDNEEYAWLQGGSEEWDGNGYDSDNNAADFFLMEMADPRNSENPGRSPNIQPSWPDSIYDFDVNYNDTEDGYLTFEWESTAFHNLGVGAKYELRYWVWSGFGCQAGLNWNSAAHINEALLPPPPAEADVSLESVVDGSLIQFGESALCFGIRVFNGYYWSEFIRTYDPGWAL